MRAEVLFWFSLLLCLASFLLMAYQVVTQMRRPPPSGAGGLGGAQPQSLNVKEILEEVGKTAGAFAKAGPIATSAVLCVLFAVIALVTSGAIKIQAG